MYSTQSHTRVKSFVLGCALFISTLAPVASADQVSDLQAQLNQVLQQIATLRAQANAPTAISGGACGLTGVLRRGSAGAQVRALQSFLAQDIEIYPEQSVTGYFGPATERAVQRFQAREGIVSSGSAFETGYGMVGNRTRARINELCGGGTGASGGGDLSGMSSGPVGRVADFSFSGTPRSPWNTIVTFGVLDGLCTSYDIDWGDGSPHETYNAPQAYAATNATQCGVGVTTRTLTHTYTQVGTVTATVRAVRGSLSTTMPVAFKKSFAVTAGDPYVKVLAPTDGTALRLGEYTKVKWDVANPPDSAAIAFYMVGPTTTYSFAKRSLRTKEFDWIVGDRVCDGNSCDVQMPAGQYRVRAVMYTPLDACIDFCTPDDPIAKVVATSETGTFSVGTIGTGGSSPVTVASTRGYAPLTTNVHVEIQPTATAQNFELDFGDGTTKYTIAVPPGETRTTVRDVAHTFTKVGTFTIALRPVGAVQNVGSASVVIDSPTFAVTPATGSLAPTVVKATFPVDTSCSLAPNTTRRYTVDWGDASETSVYDYAPTLCANSAAPGAQSVSSQTFTHSYAIAGSRTVKLRSATPSGTYDAVATVSIGSSTFAISPSFGFAPFSATATFSVDSGCSTTGTAVTKTYTVDWGDGTPVGSHVAQLAACSAGFAAATADQVLVHTYATVGTYTAKLKVQRSDSADIFTRTQDVVADKTAFQYLWRLTQYAFGHAGDAVANSVAAAATSVYTLMNGYAE